MKTAAKTGSWNYSKKNFHVTFSFFFALKLHNTFYSFCEVMLKMCQTDIKRIVPDPRMMKIGDKQTPIFCGGRRNIRRQKFRLSKFCREKLRGVTAHRNFVVCNFVVISPNQERPFNLYKVTYFKVFMMKISEFGRISITYSKKII